MAWLDWAGHGTARRGWRGGGVMNLRDHLLDIRERHGQLTPRIVVEEARDPNHPLHSQVFDKPVEEAAEAYYLDRARRVLQVVMGPSYEDKNGDRHRLRAFQAIRRETGHVYEPTEEIAADPVATQILLMEMRREWKAMQARYGQFKEFAQMIQADIGREAS